MKVRVLGCSGAIARDCRTTSFLVDGRLLVDAGTGVGDLTLAEMAAIDDVLLTHAHLDHVAALPLMLDAVGPRAAGPVRVHALPGTLQALRDHVFNGVLWPDFCRLPSPAAPFAALRPLAVGQVLDIGGRQVEVLPAVHTVPAAGYALRGERGWWAYSGDTGPNPALWQRLNRLPLAALVIETAFSDDDADLARRSLHLSPRELARELAQLAPARRTPVYITHTKPAQTARIMAEIQAVDDGDPAGGGHDIRWLQAGQEIDA